MTDPVERSGRGADEVRPRPQYGEYATPEEQRARIRQPDMTRLLETGQDPDALGGAVPPDSPSRAGKPAGSSLRRGRFADRVATIALLVYGLVNVVTTIPAILDYDSYVGAVLQVLGIEGEISDLSAARPWAIAAVLVLAIGWMLTAWVSWRRLARERLTWWIPLVAGLAFTFISGLLLMVPIVSDPLLWSAILDSTR